METPETLEPSILGAIRRYHWLVLLCVLLGTAIGALYSFATPRLYVASALIAVKDPRTVSVFGDTGAFVPPQRYTANQAEIVRSAAVAERAAEVSEGSGLTAGDYLGATSVSTDLDSDIIQVQFTAATPAVAQLGANSLVEAYEQEQIEQARERTAQAISELENTISEIDDRLGDGEIGSQLPTEAQTAQRVAEIQRRAKLQERIDQLRVDAELASIGTTLVSPAPLPGPANSGGLRVIAVGGAFGLLAGATLAYLLTLRRGTVDSRHEPGLLLEAPLLAEVPNFRDERLATGLPLVDAKTSSSAEAFRFAAGALGIRLESLSAKSVIGVSGLPGEGKSTVIANVAVALAQQSRRVLVIDADFGNQTISQLLLGPTVREWGITELATGTLRLDDVVHRSTPLPNIMVDVLTRGQVSVAPDFFHSPEVTTLMEDICAEYDVVLIDAPPLLRVAYAGALLRIADAALIVVPHRVPIAEVQEVADRLEFIGKPIAGYVYNRAPLRAEMIVSQDSIPDTLGPASPSSSAAPGIGFPPSQQQRTGARP